VALIILKVALHSAGGMDWRLILGLGAIPALIAVTLRSRIAGSSRWLMLNGHFADTTKAFSLLGVEVREAAVTCSRSGAAGMPESVD
jgi:SP family arabinose:H+ symporter-like MFS transporter